MHDPYAPPPTAAAVPREDASRGRLVRIAIGLYVASFLLTLPSAAAMLLAPDAELDAQMRPYLLASVAVTLVLMALVTAFISHRLLHRSRFARGWLVGFTPVWVAFLFWPGMAWEEFGWEMALETAATSVRIVAGLMMFLPGVRRWFVDRNVQAAPHARAGH